MIGSLADKTPTSYNLAFCYPSFSRNSFLLCSKVEKDAVVFERTGSHSEQTGSFPSIGASSLAKLRRGFQGSEEFRQDNRIDRIIFPRVGTTHPIVGEGRDLVAPARLFFFSERAPSIPPRTFGAATVFQALEAKTICPFAASQRRGGRLWNMQTFQGLELLPIGSRHSRLGAGGRR